MALRICDSCTIRPCQYSLLHKGLGPLGLEGRAQFLGSMGDLLDHWELELLVVHLHHMFTTALLIGDGGGMDDLYGAGIRTVASSHFLVKLAHRSIDVHIAELLVHVVRVGAAVVAQPDAVVLHLGW